MNNEQQKDSGGVSYSLPTLFSVYNAFHPADVERIIKNKTRRLKAHPMFLLVYPVLLQVPGIHP